MLGYWGAWNDWQSCVHVVAKRVLCGCASVHCAPRPTALQHAGALQSCSSCHLLVALQAMHWCYWLVLGFRVYGFGCRTVTASYMHEKHAGNLKSWCPLQGRQGTHLWGLVWVVSQKWSPFCYSATQPMSFFQARLARRWQVTFAHTYERLVKDLGVSCYVASMHPKAWQFMLVVC